MWKSRIEEDRSALADEVSTAVGAHLSGVNSACGDVGAIAGPVGDAAAIHAEGHFAVEDDVGRFGGVGMVGIVGVRTILPNVGMDETFRAKLIFDGFEVHGLILTPSI